MEFQSFDVVYLHDFKPYVVELTLGMFKMSLPLKL